MYPVAPKLSPQRTAIPGAVRGPPLPLARFCGVKAREYPKAPEAVGMTVFAVILTVWGVTEIIIGAMRRASSGGAYAAGAGLTLAPAGSARVVITQLTGAHMGEWRLRPIGGPMSGLTWLIRGGVGTVGAMTFVRGAAEPTMLTGLGVDPGFSSVAGITVIRSGEWLVAREEGQPQIRARLRRRVHHRGHHDGTAELGRLPARPAPPARRRARDGPRRRSLS